MFHVIGTSTDERDGINGRDCSMPPSSAPANITDLDIDMVRLNFNDVLMIVFAGFVTVCYFAEFGETHAFISWLAVWRSGNSNGRISEVTLRRARLVQGWVMCTGSTPGGGTLFRYVTSHPGRLSLSSFRAR